MTKQTPKNTKKYSEINKILLYLNFVSYIPLKLKITKFKIII